MKSHFTGSCLFLMRCYLTRPLSATLTGFLCSPSPHFFPTLGFIICTCLPLPSFTLTNSTVFIQRLLRSADVRILKQLVALHEGIEAMRWLLEDRGPLTSRGSSLTESLSSLATVDEHEPLMSSCRCVHTAGGDRVSHSVGIHCIFNPSTSIPTETMISRQQSS